MNPKFPNPNLMKTSFFCAATLLALFSSAHAENIVYPPDSGVLNVKSAAFGAKGDGTTDDTAAIQKALSAAVSKHKIVYLPDGTYRVSDTLKWNNGDPTSANGGWAPFAQLQGQSRAKTIVKLADDAAGFGDVAAPKAVIQTGSSAGHGNKKYSNGEGNEAFENHIRNLSVDAGKNAGAIGIDYQVSNCGAMREVSIKGAGAVGVQLERRDNGPGLLKNVSIEGFDWGIRARQDICQMTLESVALSNQKVGGISQNGAIFAVRKLTSKNSVPAIELSGAALLVLLDSEFSGGAGDKNAINAGDKARMVLRNLKSTGYGALLKQGEKTEKDPISEWSSQVLGSEKSLNLLIRETPEFWDADLKNWVSPGPASKKDDTAAIQKAMDSGKSTVYFPGDGYKISDTIVVPPSVKLVVGLGTTLGVIGPEAKKPMIDDKPMFRMEGGTAGDTTIFDRLTFSASQGRVFDHAGPRTVVLRDLMTFSTRGVYRNAEGAGPVFIEDIAGTNYEFAAGTQVWARQLNIEGNANPRLWNKGATVWALGWKTEGEALVALNEGGGSLEMLGGLTYTFGMKPEMAAIENRNSNLSVSFGGTTYAGPKGFYRVLVREKRGETIRELGKKAVPSRGGGVMVTLYSSRKDDDLLKTAALSEPGATVQTVADEKPAADAKPKEDKPKTDKPKKEAAPAPGITLENAVSTEGGATIFRMNDSWKGTETDAATGNPLVLAGKPTWRFDSINGDEADKWENYAPLTWSGKKWQAAENVFGRPEAQVSNGVARPTVRGAWSGKPGKKRAALVFIAPSAGKYTLEGSALIDFFNGDKAKPMTFDFVKLDPTAKTATVLSSLEVAHETATEIKVEVELAAGQELAIVPQIGRKNTAANVKLSELKVTLAAK